jgi:hypothetical protein
MLSEAQKLVRSLVGHSVNLQDLSMPSLPWQRYGREKSYPEPEMQNPLKLPDVNILNEYVLSYGTSPTRLSFPIIDLVLFKSTISLAYEISSTHSPGASSARACIYAFLSLPGVWDLHATHPLSIDSRELVSAAERYIPQIIQEETMDGLQAILMLVCICH